MSDGPFIRNHFFAGRFLTAADLELEQNYFRDKLRLHNRSLHGFGIVSGLEVSHRQDKLIIACGLALDCQGNEILIVDPVSHSLPDSNLGTSSYLTISYSEQATNPTLVPDDKLCEPALIAESFTLGFESQNPNQHHRHEQGRWVACGQSHSLVLARLRRSSGGWRIDRRLHRAAVK